MNKENGALKLVDEIILCLHLSVFIRYSDIRARIWTR